MLGDHNMFRKTFPYEASARVPFFARAPRDWNLPQELVCDSPVGLQDVMPTLLDVAGVQVPDTCTGKSLLPVMRGEAAGVRDVLHGEHSGCYEYNDGNHYLTDGHSKYIWYTQTGREHLFDLDNDPDELRDQALQAGAEQKLQPWRDRLIEVLKGRPEGFTDGNKLVVGQTHKHLLPGYDPNASYAFT
jgi:arylsulfatase A-like enzyme